MSAIDDCFDMGLLLHVPPSEEDVEESLARAESYLEESRMAAAAGAYKISLNGAWSCMVPCRTGRVFPRWNMQIGI